MTFETIQNPAVYLSGERVSIIPVLVPQLLVKTSPPKRPNVITGEIWYKPGPDVIKLFSYSTQHEISTALKWLNIRTFLAFKLSDIVFSIQINVKMTTITIVGI